MKINKALFVLLVLSPLAMFFTKYSWWILILSYFVWPIAICMFILFVRFFLKKELIAALCCVVSMIVITIYQYQKPNLPSYLHKTTAENYLSVYHCNVDKPNKKFDTLIDSVLSADADIVVLEEIDDRWKNAIENKLHERYPYFIIQAQKDCYGLAVFSKYMIINVKSDLLDSPYVRSFRCEISWKDKNIVLWATRLFSPLTPHRWKIRNTQIKALSTRVSLEGGPVLVAGDLNLDIRDPHFSDLLKTSGLYLCRENAVYPRSWPSMFPSFFRIAIDHVLAGHGAYPHRIEVLKSVDSDHLPVLAQIVVE